MKGIFFADKSSSAFSQATFYDVFNEYTIERLSNLIEISPEIVSRVQMSERAKTLAETELLFSSWGIGELTEQEIRTFFPKLKAIFYAAGTVKFFAQPFFNCGVRVFSSQAANAVPVAEFTLAHILLANKGAIRAFQKYGQDGYMAAKVYAGRCEGNFQSRVGILGAGRIGRKVIELLQPFDLDVLVYDRFLSIEEASDMGITRASLDLIFSTCGVISNHLADNSETRGLIHYEYLSQMNDYSTLINTGAGPQVPEVDLLAVLRENPTITAVLDVTEPEPLPLKHPFFSMENVILTPRISGSISNEVARMGEYMLEECEAFIHSRPLRYEITADMLRTMG